MQEAAAEQTPACPHCGGTHPPDRLRCPQTDEILPLEGRLLDGKFRFIEQIGKGGMASVWSAYNLNVDKEVAIKLIRPEVARSNENVARFRAEARAAGRIGHRNICDIHDLGFSPIGPYIVMERLEGSSLGELLRQKGKLEPTLVVDIVTEALAGLAAAHEAGIVHRDLKPENLFLHRPSGAATIVKVMDFGVSKFTGGGADAETGTGALLGTPEYMAPEQVEGASKVDARTDLWAMGVVLYETLSGTSPFRGPSIASSLLMVSAEEPAPLDSLTSEIPPGLVEVVHQCLRKNPAERYETAAELADALAPFGSEASRTSMAGETRVGARLEGSGGGRSRARFALAASALAGLVVVGLVTVGLSRPTDESLVEVVEEPAAEPKSATEPESPEPEEETVVAATVPEVTKIEVPIPVPMEPTKTEPGPVPVVTPPEPVVAPPVAPPEPAPEPVIVRVGKLRTMSEPPPLTDLGGARRACEIWRAERHGGVSTWKLANPRQTREFEGNPGVKPGPYWTTAVHKGSALVIRLPAGGDADSIATSKRAAHPMCISESR